MKIQEVIDRAIQDPIFAGELAGMAGRASRDRDANQRAQGDTWKELLREFADGPEELGRMFVEGADEVAHTTTVTTSTTITTLTTLACSTTTTTTTTSVTTDVPVVAES